MTSLDLVRSTDAILWELRHASTWGRRVALMLTDVAGRRIEGHVASVSATGSSVMIRCDRVVVLVPAETILAVHYPRQWMGEETTWDGKGRFDRPARVEPQADRLPNPEGWS